MTTSFIIVGLVKSRIDLSFVPITTLSSRFRRQKKLVIANGLYMIFQWKALQTKLAIPAAYTLK